MKRTNKAQQAEGKLGNSLVLNRYILSIFGATSLEALSEHLKDPVLEGWDEEGVSHFYYAIRDRLFTNSDLTEQKLLAYDENIRRYTLAISEKRGQEIKWKYFQYLSLLFTEIYLDRYFTNKDALLEDINTYLLTQFNADPSTWHGMEELKAEDLNKLAMWSATGSGKTLLMHMNYQQFMYYSKRAGKKMNRTLLITPNEGLSTQHLDELKQSNIDAQIFSKQAGTLFSGHGIDIIEITKLGDVDGDKTVAVDSFESNNLVFVDEGHRGSGGDAWKQRRDKLCADGFSFEYSATFGQSISAISNAGKRKAMLEEYGKATLFDYSYRYFYNDGYGKDYQILNLNDTWSDASMRLYLTACLLNFYEQQRLFADNRVALKPFLLEKPLAVFVGGSVSAEKKIGTQEVSDIVFILKFFEDFVDNKSQAVDDINSLMTGIDGLTDKKGHPVFSRQFAYLRSLDDHDAGSIYSDILRLVFHSEISGAKLHLDNLRGKDGEIGMRMGTSDYFGIINVGDSDGLAKKCAEAGIRTMQNDYAAKSLFATINDDDSKLNVLIGSKKFTEGWSSWRVSTMGLLNVGKSEGSQIIQLFGRGVRLKGYKFSLKRTSALDPSLQPDSKPQYIQNLETLNIFGIKADYMEQFKQFLEDEGLPTNDSDFEEFEVPIMPVVDLRSKRLKYLRVKEGCDFKKDVVVTIVPGMIDYTPVTIDYYPKIQTMASDGRKSMLDNLNGTLHKAHLTEEHLAFTDWNKIYFSIINYKNERGWYNLNVSIDALKEIASRHDWYTLFIPEPQMNFTDFREQTLLWQEVLTVLLRSYVEKAYNNAKSKWMSEHVEVAYLDASHPNFDEMYRVTMHKELAKNDDEAGFFKTIRKLKDDLNNGTFKNYEMARRVAQRQDFEILNIGSHLYQPLLYLNDAAFTISGVGKLIEVKPVALNRGERDFVCDIQRFYDSNKEFFNGKSLYVLRNKSRKGIGFFDTSGFYPDFILWLIVDNHQYVSFIDPKGITHLRGFEDPKIQLYKTIREEIQRTLDDKDITMNSFIVSNTELKEVRYWADFRDEAIYGSRQKQFNDHHVYFQNDQKTTYVRKMLEDMLKSE